MSSKDERATSELVKEVLHRAQEIIAERFPETGYVVVMVDTSGVFGNNLQYATNFNAAGLRLVGEVLCEEFDPNEIPDPPKGALVQ